MLATDLDLVTEKAKQAFRAEQAAKNKLNNARSTDPNKPLIQEVVDHWKVICNHPKAVVEATADDDRWDAVRRRIGQFSVADLKQAVNGAARFPYLVNKERSEAGTRKQRWDDLELICRNPKNVQKFMALALDEDGEPMEIRPHEPVVAARYLDDAVQEAAGHARKANELRTAVEILRDFIATQEAYIARLEAELEDARRRALRVAA